MIEYKDGKGKDEGNVLVFLDNTRVGTIKEVEKGFQYFPWDKSEGGKVYLSLDGCKRSLEEE